MWVILITMIPPFFIIKQALAEFESMRHCAWLVPVICRTNTCTMHVIRATEDCWYQTCNHCHCRQHSRNAELHKNWLHYWWWCFLHSRSRGGTIALTSTALYVTCLDWGGHCETYTHSAVYFIPLSDFQWCHQSLSYHCPVLIRLSCRHVLTRWPMANNA